MLIFLILFLGFGNAQDQDIKEEIEYYYSLYKLWAPKNLDSALVYANKAHQIATRTKSQDYLSKTTYALGYIKYMREEDDQALKLLKKSISLSSPVSDVKTEIAAHYRLSRIYSFANKADSSLVFGLMAESILSSNEIGHEDFGDLYRHLGNLYEQKEDSVGHWLPLKKH